MMTFTLAAARSISTAAMPAFMEVLLHHALERDVLVEPGSVVALLEPLGVPGLDDAEAEPVRWRWRRRSR
jgi:hypothetical protein